MNNPQDLARELATIKTFDTQATFACCAYVYLWCLHIEPEDVEAIKIVDEAVRLGKIDDECTVNWARMGAWLTGREIEVIFDDKITSIKKIKERTPVWYSVNGKTGHWVGVENGKIAFNPKKYSTNVVNGKPMKARYIKIKGLIK